MAQLIAVFTTSRLDHCNAVLACLPACSTASLHRVQNAAAARCSCWVEASQAVWKLCIGCQFISELITNFVDAFYSSQQMSLKDMVSLCSPTTMFDFSRYGHKCRLKNSSKAWQSCVFVLRAYCMEQTARLDNNATSFKRKLNYSSFQHCF